ncbi:hypothetical protein [Caldibacillus thermoamylovorans]|uniref:hypothetical protein n=1 Tax=Caldibacillus thermoamylovorans TaxID=35841 RepID=UPI00203AF67B|nr:hypothetical protein [Caldibacillus thermoamylovorans]MCM3476198.1 hypothetical protein [Caldibacillus thermoamylovorans]
MNNELKTMLESIIQEALKPIKEEMQTIKGEVQTIKGEVQTLKGDMQTIKDEVQTLKGDMQTIKCEAQTIKSQVNENTQLLKAVIHRQEETDAKLDAISMDVHKLHGEINYIKEEMSDIKTTVDFTYQKTTKNELEIFKLKQN